MPWMVEQKLVVMQRLNSAPSTNGTLGYCKADETHTCSPVLDDKKKNTKEFAGTITQTNWKRDLKWLTTWAIWVVDWKHMKGMGMSVWLWLLSPVWSVPPSVFQTWNLVQCQTISDCRPFQIYISWCPDSGLFQKLSRGGGQQKFFDPESGANSR